MADDSGFLGRWSRRKALVRAGGQAHEAPLEEAPHPPASAAPLPAEVPAAAQAPGPDAAPVSTAPAPPALTLDDVAALRLQDDFSPFVAREVAPEVRNAAMKKLFADPSFNVMDGLDIYIDDYSKPDPLPAALARQLVSAQFMKLFDAPAAEPAAADASTAVASPLPQAAAQAAPLPAAPPVAGSAPAATDPFSPPLPHPPADRTP